MNKHRFQNPAGRATKYNAYNGDRELECFEVQQLRLLLSEIAREVAKNDG